jgi:hypothetical protein
MGFFSKIWKAVTKPFKKIISWLIPTPDTPAAQAVTVEKQGSDHAIPVVYGTRRIGGIKVHKYVTDATGGAKNEYLHIIVVFCEGPIQGIEEIYFDGVSEFDQRWIKKKGGGAWHSITKVNGAADQTAVITGIPNWTGNHRLAGLAYAYIRLQMDEEQSVWRGEPEITARIAGRRIADPRTGQTVYSENLPLQLLDYLTNTTFGKGLARTRLHQQSFIDAADWADGQVTSDVTINGETTLITHARITGNLVVNTGNSVFSNVKLMLSGMRGMLPIGSGQLRLVPEKEGAPEFYFGHTSSIRQNYALITSPMKSKAGRKNDRFNRVIIRFPNKLTDFERDEVHYPDANDPLFVEWLAEDNGVLLEQSFEFDTITNKAEAYQMAEIVAKRSRNRLEVSFSASPAAIVVEPGDIVGISDDTRGWDEKPFRVEQCKLREDGDVDFEFVEHQNAIYPWSGVAYSERIGGTNLGDPTNIAAPTALAIIADPTFATGGKLTWSAISDAFIRRFRVILLRDGVKVLDREEQGKMCVLPLLSVGEYTASVSAVSTLGTLSDQAAITFSVILPVPPQSIDIEAGNFTLTAIPMLTGVGLGTDFEFAIQSIGNYRGRGRSMVFSDLLPATEYTIYARTVSALGQSEWVSVTGQTSNDPTVLIDFIGEALGQQITPSIVDSVSSQVNQYIDQKIAELPDEAYVRSLLDEALAGVGSGAENPYDTIGDLVNEILDNFEREKDIKEETKERVSSNLTLTAQITQEAETRTSQIQQLNQTIADESSTRAIQINSLTSSITNESQTRSSAINQLNQTIANESETRATQINSLASSITTESQTRASAITQLNQTIADESGTRATQINSLTSAITTEGQTRAASIEQLNQTIASESLARATQYTQLSASNNTLLQNLQQVQSDVGGNRSAISTLAGTVNSPTNGLSATFVIASEAKTTAEGQASAITSLGTRVTNAEGGLSSANLALSSHSNSLGQLFSRAFLGVSSTWNGITTVNGILVDGQTNSIDFRAGSIRFTDLAGNVQFYWNAAMGQFVFAGVVNAATILSSEISGSTLRGGLSITGEGPSSDYVKIVSATPFGTNGRLIEWYGPKSSAWYNYGSHQVNTALLHLVNPAQALSFLTKDGTGFVKGSFFQGQIIESKTGQASNTSGALTAYAYYHQSDGKAVKVTGQGSAVYMRSGNHASLVLSASIELRRNTSASGLTTIGSAQYAVNGIYEPDDGPSGTTRWFINYGVTAIDTRTAVEPRDYLAQVVFSGAIGSSVQSRNVYVETFENKLAS